MYTKLPFGTKSKLQKPTSRSKYPFQTMAVGECYEFNLKELSVSRHSVYTARRTAVRLAAAQGVKKVFTSSIIGDVMYYWRIE